MGATRFFHSFSGMGRAFLQTKFLAIGSFLGHLSMKKVSRQREGAGGGGGDNTPIEQKLTYFLTMNMIFNIYKFWYDVR